VVKCLVEGGTYGDCFCQMYHSLCLTYGDERPYQVSLYGMLFLFLLATCLKRQLNSIRVDTE
jgi:hypothetical protein